MEQETFKDALARTLKQQGVSRSELGRRLAAATDRSAESWRRQLGKYPAGVEPEEKTVRLIAAALGVSRSEFPPVLTLAERVSELQRELEALRAMLSARRQ